MGGGVCRVCLRVADVAERRRVPPGKAPHNHDECVLQVPEPKVPP